MKKKPVIALIAVIIAALLFGGGILAYSVFWSGGAVITIETPTIGFLDDGETLQVTEIGARGYGSTFKDGVWTVALIRGTEATLFIEVQNLGNGYATIEAYVNGKSEDVELAPGVVVCSSGPHMIAPTLSYSVRFMVDANQDAQPTEEPFNVSLEIRVKE